MNSSGLYVELPITFTPNPGDPPLEQYYPNDSILMDGSDYLYDFENPVCYPSQAANLPAGTVLKNLVDGKEDAVVFGSGLTYASGGVTFPAWMGVDRHINLGLNYGLAAAGNPDVLFWHWFAVADATQGYMGLMQRAEQTNPAKSEFSSDMGENGDKLRVSFYNQNGAEAGGTKVIERHKLVLGAYGIYKDNFFLSVNNELISQSPFAKPYSAPAVNHPLVLGGYGGFGRFVGQVFRTGRENLTKSKRNPFVVIAEEWAANKNRAWPVA